MMDFLFGALIISTGFLLYVFIVNMWDMLEGLFIVIIALLMAYYVCSEIGQLAFGLLQ